MAPHWSADVVQSTLVLVFFIVVPKVLSSMVLSFVTQFPLLGALDYFTSTIQQKSSCAESVKGLHTGQLMWYNPLWYW
jgi:hypothetical protein